MIEVVALSSRIINKSRFRSFGHFFVRRESDCFFFLASVGTGARSSIRTTFIEINNLDLIV